ncbi:hypothetical protein B0H14DRAFT_3485375 [Mycena olivaceomarginata]|nr:hypothetical protein B0H14DRAFT_3485375 [Mycena olivaceomarginata]
MCPPGVDQTTRSSPLWTFLAPGLGQKQQLPSDRKERWYDAGPLGFFNSGLSWDAFGKLAHVGRDRKSPFLLRQLVRAPDMSSRLEKLAAELLCIISAGLDLQDECQRRMAPWAGTPIICTSTHLTSVPDSFRQSGKLADTQIGQKGGRACLPYAGGTGEPLNDYSEVVDVHSLSSQCKWVLRNLDTKEVVHFQAVKREGFKDTVCLAVSGLPWLTLDFVLTLRILWPDLNRYNDPQPSNVKVGAWAGHKFDVVETANLETG